ncbi:hypothetical protein DXG03_006160 [Asterophora parasitica]|uniref:3'-5' exonuclease domain-containing protein n=1 Tax=Asterophora parasitica TaxID=117018 RepID=A0A9P7GJ09_9AGAR|nr:hypothetical protein DXG03_006160 [Asterophora parasitica]
MPEPPPAPAPVLDPYSWRNISPNAELLYIRDPDEADIHVAALDGPVGFDLEWKPTFTKNTPENPVALVQLANRDTILLIQVSAMRGKALAPVISVLQVPIESLRNFRIS